MTTPKSIARYEVLNRIGRGGMGSLYLARDPNIDRLVAVKLLNADLERGDVRDRFAREARAAGALNHPNIVTIFDYGVFDDQPFIVMEYIRGETLAEIIKRRAPVPVAHKIGLLEQLCGGLAYAHDSGIIHRDIKPANLMIDHRGGLKVLDFGIARLADSGVTHRSGYVGTAGYMSPEQIEGQPADRRSDLFAVGVVAYELLTYRQAFHGETQASMVHAVLHSHPAPIQSVVPEVGSDLAAIVERALEKTPAARYQDAGALQRDLKKAGDKIDDTHSEDVVGGRYHIVRVLGEGGMGRVYLARDSELDRLVAIKVLSGSIDQHRFRLEAKAAARLKHPAIITIYDISEHGGKPFIAMEYVTGDSMATVIRERQVPSVVDRLKLIEQLCGGLAAAHERGIIHRDIKPSNLMVEDGLRLRILDFGVAKAVDSGAMLHGTVVGSHGYMAPELLAGEPFDHRIDLFAVCVVAYELLSYDRAYPRGVAQCLSDTSVESLEFVVPGVGTALDDVLRKGLDRNPDNRHENGEALRRAFAEVRETLEQHPADATMKLSGVEALRLELERKSVGRARAKVAIERGRQSLEERAWGAARRSADEALALDPDNTEAIGLREAADGEGILSQSPRPSTGSLETKPGTAPTPRPPTGPLASSSSSRGPNWAIPVAGAVVLFVAAGLLWYQPWAAPKPAAPQVNPATAPAAVPDTTPPVVTVTSPRSGDAFSGPVSIVVTASDNVALAGVQIKVDDVSLGPELTSAPFETKWTAAGARDGAHVISAVARDVAGNIAKAEVTVTTQSAQAAPQPEGQKGAGVKPNSAPGADRKASDAAKLAEAEQIKKDQLQSSDALSSKGDFVGALNAVKKALENPLLAKDPALISKRDALDKLVKRSGGGGRGKWS